MKVYIVQEWFAWEGFELKKIFSNLESAKAYCEKQCYEGEYIRQKDTEWEHKEEYTGYRIEEFEVEQ
jgi:hypothetical protein